MHSFYFKISVSKLEFTEFLAHCLVCEWIKRDETHFLIVLKKRRLVTGETLQRIWGSNANQGSPVSIIEGK